MIVESYEDRIILSGALRSNFWDTIHTAISLALKTSPQGVIIDCSQITEATPEGADTFRDIMEFLRNHDARVIVAAVPEVLLTVLKTVPEVRSQLPIADTVESARASLMRLHDDEDDYGKKKKKADRPVSGKYLVVLFGQASDEYTLQIACEHAQASQSGLVLMHPIIVPLALPLQSPLEEEETAGANALELGKSICISRSVPCELVLERGRDVASIIAETLSESTATQVFVPIACDEDDQGATGKLVRSVMQKIKSPVLFVRARVD